MLILQSVTKGSDKEHWDKTDIAEWKRLINSNTTDFQPAHILPPDRRASYYNPQIKTKLRLNGEWEDRVRGTYGGNRSDYTVPTATDSVDMATFKLLLNSTVSNEKAKLKIST